MTRRFRLRDIVDSRRKLVRLRGFGFVLVATTTAGCLSRYQADQREIVTVEACCKSANADMLRFQGCRTTPVCSIDEPLWLRGELSCGPADARDCQGGRCCTYVHVRQPEKLD